MFHLAAQPLVRRSYRDPLLTWQTDVMGTLHLLEALRQQPGPCATVCVTTDKVYENSGGSVPFHEADRLDGSDPYSSSKAAMELATVRAGNVIGGGDWAEDRIPF